MNTAPNKSWWHCLVWFRIILTRTTHIQNVQTRERERAVWFGSTWSSNISWFIWFNVTKFLFYSVARRRKKQKICANLKIGIPIWKSGKWNRCDSVGGIKLSFFLSRLFLQHIDLLTKRKIGGGDGNQLSWQHFIHVIHYMKCIIYNIPITIIYVKK